MNPKILSEKLSSLNLMDFCALLCLLVTGWFLYERVIFSGPFETHALIALTRGASVTLEDFWSTNLSSPGLRPLASFSFVFDNLLFGLNVSLAYIENICWLALCLWLAYIFFRKITGHAQVALIATIFVISDPRFITVVKWLTGRQTTMTAAFGFIALIATISFRNKSSSVLYIFTVFIFLVLSVLCKEYGLIFIVSVPICSFLYARHRTTQALLASLAAICSYAILRILMVPSRTVGVFASDTMAYWGKLKNATTTSDFTDLNNLLQISYNIFAGLVTGFLPSLSDNYYGYAGILGVNYSFGSLWANLNYFMIILIPFFICVCFYNSKKLFTIGTLMIVLNALLCFALFRQRNLFIGAVGLWMMVCFGAYYSLLWLRSKTDKIKLASCLIIMIISIGILNVSASAAKINSHISAHIKSKCPMFDVSELKVKLPKISTEVYAQLLKRYSSYIENTCPQKNDNAKQ